MQILLVEDDLSLAEGLQKGLGREGFTVNHVSNGADAIHNVTRTGGGQHPQGGH